MCNFLFFSLLSILLLLLLNSDLFSFLCPFGGVFLAISFSFPSLLHFLFFLLLLCVLIIERAVAVEDG